MNVRKCERCRNPMEPFQQTVEWDVYRCTMCGHEERVLRPQKEERELTEASES